jgi:hypothetical protein
MEPRFHYRFHNSQPFLSILSQINLAQAAHPIPWRCTLILFSHLRLLIASFLFPSGLLTQNSHYARPPPP